MEVKNSDGFVYEASLFRRSDVQGVELVSSRCVGVESARHWHEEYAVSFIASGCNRYWTKLGSEIAPENSVKVFNPGEVHANLEVRIPWAQETFYISRDGMRSITNRLFGKPTQPLLSQKILEGGKLVPAISKLANAFAYSKDPLKIDAEFLTTFAALFQRDGIFLSKHLPRRENAAMRKAREFLHDRYDENVRLSEISNHVQLTEFYFVRVFCRTFGMPPHAFQKQIRIHRAKALLRQGMAAGWVAHKVGFSDQSHLNRELKRNIGVTPGVYLHGRGKSGLWQH
jgi:AraC-like DNA-binding protein